MNRLKRKRWRLFILLILLFIATVILYLFDGLDFIDNNIYNLVNTVKCDSMTIFFKFVSNLVSPVVLFAITLFSLFFKNKTYFKMISLNLLIIISMNQFLKFIFTRERPIDMIISVGGYSFPSGHSMVSMAFYGLIAYIIYKNVKNKYIKWISISFIFLIIFLIGLSRIYLRVHYPSDVIAGFCLSLSYLIIFITFVMSKKMYKNIC